MMQEAIKRSALILKNAEGQEFITRKKDIKRDKGGNAYVHRNQLNKYCWEGREGSI